MENGCLHCAFHIYIYIILIYYIYISILYAHSPHTIHNPVISIFHNIISHARWGRDIGVNKINLARYGAPGVGVSCIMGLKTTMEYNS